MGIMNRLSGVTNKVGNKVLNIEEIKRKKSIFAKLTKRRNS